MRMGLYLDLVMSGKEECRVVKRFSKIRLWKFFIILVFDSQKLNIVSYTSLCNCTNL